MANTNNEWKVQLGAELKSDVKKDIQNQLDAYKNLKIDVDNVLLGQSIASSVQKQLDKLSINLNIGKINIGNNIKGLSKQVSSQLKNGLGNPLQIFNVSDLQKNGIAYMTKVSKTINKQMAEIQKMANAQGWQDFNVTGIEKANGKIKSLTMTVTDATGALKQLNFQREYIETNTGNKHLGLVQTEDVKIIKTATQAEKEFIHALENAKIKADEINRNAVQDLKYDIDTKAFETDIVTLENHLKKFRDVAEQSNDKVVQSFYETKSAYEHLVTTMKPNSGFDNTARLQALEQYQKALEKTNNYVKQLRSDGKNIPLDLGDDRRLNMIARLNNYLAKNTAMSKDAKRHIEEWVRTLESSDDLTVGSLQNINTQFKILDSQLRKSGQLGLSWSDKLKQAWEKFGGWSLATGALTSMVQFLRQMPKEVIAIDTAMTNLYKVTDETSVRYNEFLKSATNNAQKLGRTVSGLITQTSEWAKLGYSLNDAEQLSKVSSIYANVGEVDDATAVSDMVTAMKAFNIEADNAIEIVNMYNKLGNEFATSAKSLGSGLSKSASSMATSGTNINKTLAMLTGGSEITQNATEFGNFLKVSSMRLRGMTGELEALGEEVDSTVDSISKVQTQVLNRTGGKVNIFDDMGNFRDYYDVMLDISKVYDDLSSTDKASLTEILFGKMRGNQGAALIQAFQSGQIQKALQATYDAAGSAEEEQAKWLQSEEAKIEQLKAAYQSLSQTIFDSNLLKTGTDSLRLATNLLEEIIDKTGVLVPLVGTLGSLGIFKNLDHFKNLGDISNANKTITNILSNKFLSTDDMNKQLAASLKQYSIATIEAAAAQTGLTKEQAKAILIEKELKGKQLKTTAAQIEKTAATTATTTSQTAATASTFSLKTAYDGLAVSLGISTTALTVWIAALAAVAVGALALKSYNDSLEKLASDTKANAQETKAASKELENYTAQYSELRKELLDANTTEERQAEIKKELLAIQTDLNEKYGDEYGKINLVTDAYKDQTEVLKNLNKELAEDWLQDNHKGITQAREEIEKTRSYTTSGANISLTNNALGDIRSIVEKYSDQGASLVLDDTGMAYTIKVTANAEEAQKVLDQIGQEIYTLYTSAEYKDNLALDGLINSLNVAEENAKSVLDNFKEQYDQAAMYQIASSSTMSTDFENAVAAVQKYNDAVASGDYSSIKEARVNLDNVRSSINLTETKWEHCGGVIEDVFDQANTKIWDFRDTLSDKDIEEWTLKLQGLDVTKLRSMENDGQDGDVFDPLVKSAQEAGLSIDELISLLQQLGIVAIETNNKPLNPKKILNKTEMIAALNELSSGFESLDKIIESQNDKSPFDYSLLAEKDFVDTFGGLGNVYADFVEQIESSPKDVEKCREAYNNLVTEWIYAKGTLKEVTEETANVTEATLKNMGVTNASEVVASALAKKKAELAWNQGKLANVISNTTDVLNKSTDATKEEIQAIADEIIALGTESGVVEEAQSSWKAYIAQKLLDKVYNGKGDIEALNNVVKALGISTDAWRKYYTAKARMEAISNDPNYSIKDYETGKVISKEDVLSGYKKYTDNLYKDVQLEFDKISTVENAFNYSGPSSSSSSSSSSSASKQFNQTFDFFERRIEVLTDAFENLGSTMDNILSAKAKNALLSAQTDILTAEINDYTSALTMYGEKAEQSLSNLDESLVYKIKNGVIELTDFTGENGETIVKAMEAYRGWAEKVEDCKNRINELKKEIAQIELTKFNNIADQYTNKFDLYGNSVDLIDKQIGLFEAAGQLVGESFYEEQIQLTNNQLDTLRAQKKELAKQMQDAIRSGNVEKGSKEWLEMVDALNEVEGKILDSKTAVEEFENAILQIDWDTFDRVQTRFDNLNNELENLASLFDDMNEISVLDDDGNWTKEAVATLGLYAQQYELAQHRVKQYSEAIQQLQDDYNDGKYSATEYADKLADLNSGQWDAVKSAESLEDAIMSLNESRVDKEIESIQEVIEAYDEYTQSQIDALEAAKELHDYEESIAEKTKSISNLEKQLAAMQNDNSSATIAKRKKLEEELAEARKDLENTEYDHSVDVQIKGLEDNNKSYEEKRQAEIEALLQSLKDRETIITQSFETVKQNADLVGQEIEQIANEHGVNVSESLIESWKSGENAIASYGETLSSSSSNFIQQLYEVESKEYELQEQANRTSESVASVFTHSSEKLVTEFNTATSSVYEMNNALTSVQNVLDSISEKGFDNSNLVDSLNEVKSAANAASRAIRDVNTGDGKGYESPTNETSGDYKIVNGYNSSKVYETGLTKSEAEKLIKTKYGGSGGSAVIMKMAKGGIVGRSNSSILDEYAKRIGEDRMIAVQDGEGILTKEQTQAFIKLIPTLNGISSSWVQQPYTPYGIEPLQNKISYNYDSILTVNGNIDDTNATRMAELIRKELKSTFSKIDRDHRYSGY